MFSSAIAFLALGSKRTLATVTQQRVAEFLKHQRTCSPKATLYSDAHN